jgi:acetyl-CoA carboxylase biotin carboxyl carrier protein
MDINEIKKLIKVFESAQITELSLKEGDLKIKLSKNGSSNIVTNMPQNFPVDISRFNNYPIEVNEQKTATNVEKKEENFHIINSPIVGTFYRAPAPDADPYVQVGDTVSSGSVLCIVEAMKLMNEIESDVSGKIVQILVENGTAVEYNQPLFKIEKS